MRQDNDRYRGDFKQIVIHCMRVKGCDPGVCAQCGKLGKTVIHHKKYDGATIDDLEFVCQRCNTQQVNKGLL